ncbi:sugar-binding domain-containing protein [Mesotoga sp.]|uniref:glycoside hydrolase family 2 protein n=1 Tax=Mesotoga sp. TaxID=2053577 RepID=UPI002C03C20E|nr:sugar-binding domain-containing protein [Mesotoga sp.]HRX66284.1 glycoside hydrolase family 2 TIM barrel-domain containing protein [Mesotoga sp.]
MRRRIDLDGDWLFEILENEPDDIRKIEPTKTIEIPGCVESAYPEVTSSQRYLYFEREFEYERNSDCSTILVFGAVDYLCKVFLNGSRLGSHRGGYLPFEFDISGVLSSRNRLQVLVFDPIDDRKIDFRRIPHGKQNGDPNWYTNISGIWQGVWIEERPPVHICRLRVDTSYLKRSLEVAFTTNEEFDRACIGVFDKSDRLLASKRSVDKSISLSLPSCLPWSPETPNLYRLVVTLESGKSRDVIERRVGFRDFVAENGKLFLNGRDFYMKAVLDQDFYPQTLYTIPSEEFLRESFAKLKKIGINTIRHHVKVPDPKYMDIADEVGLIVWQDAPHFDLFSDEGSEELLELIDGAVRRDSHHPSLCLYSIINESWGINQTDLRQVKWLIEAYERFKERFPGIVWIDNSACLGNYHLKSDLNDYHFYVSSIDRQDKWNSLIELYSESPKSFYIGEHKNNAEGRPLVVSEFGNWSLPPEIWLRKKEKPYWFNHMFNDVPMTKPEGALERFDNSEISKEYSYRELFELSVENQEENLNIEIDKMRLHENIRGFVITELSDVFWECNGLLDFDRNFKIDPERMRAILDNDLFVPLLDKEELWIGEEVNLGIFLLKDIKRETLRIKIGEEIREMPLSGERGDTVRVSLETDKFSEGLLKIEVLLDKCVAILHAVLSRKEIAEITIINNPHFGLQKPLDRKSVVVLDRPGAFFEYNGYKASTVAKDDLLSGDWITGIFWNSKLLSDVFPGGLFRRCHRSLIEDRPMISSSGYSRRLSGVVYGWLTDFYGYIDMVDDSIYLSTLHLDPKRPLANLLLRRLSDLHSI